MDVTTCVVGVAASSTVGSIAVTGDPTAIATTLDGAVYVVNSTTNTVTQRP
jgi:hypothetical protein